MRETVWAVDAGGSERVAVGGTQKVTVDIDRGRAYD
jgi:hypothetical protein